MPIVSSMPIVSFKNGRSPHGSQIARAFHANACSPGVRERATCEPLRRRALDSTASLCSI
eukprot:4405277-Lingulodinium_polyedra.AAC.1